MFCQALSSVQPGSVVTRATQTRDEWPHGVILGCGTTRDLAEETK